MSIELKAEFEQQAQSHHLYPYITFDDMREKRIQHTYLPDFLKEQQAKTSNSTMQQQIVRTALSWLLTTEDAGSPV